MVCYWFEKARDLVEHDDCKRAGLLATQGIRGGANRETLKRIKQSGDIFFAISDREWILDGANVHVSMIGFDDASEKSRISDGKSDGSPPVKTTTHLAKESDSAMECALTSLRQASCRSMGRGVRCSGER